MYADPQAESSVAGAWEGFQGGEPPPAGSVRLLVQSSWQRCAEFAVDPHLGRSTSALSEQDLYLLRERRRDLLDASAPVLAEARAHLADSGSLMALSDLGGTILGVEGDRAALDLGETIRLMPGADWSEARCGTNAIGTALRIGAPVQIHSAEHYCSGIKRWTCSAAVVRHPRDGTPFAAIDVSGLARTYHRQSLGLVVASARAVEGRLAMSETTGRLRLLEHAMGRWSAGAGDARVLFDRHGMPVKASVGAQAAIEAAGGALDLDTTRCLTEFDLRRNGRLRLPPWLRPEWLHPLVVDGERLGTLLVLPTASMAHGRPVTRPAFETDPAAGPVAADGPYAGILTRDPAMRALIARATLFAGARAPVLVQGETGVGKEAFARGLHAGRRGAYVALNCGGLSRELLAGELFGHVEGAYTGARKGGAIGKLEAADGGTLFLDEIGELPLDMQPQLLRVLEEGEFHRLGETTVRRVDLRLVAATHRDLRAEVAAGRFRMDLYYRIAVATLCIPPLRERPGDLRLLAQRFLAQFRHEQGRTAEALAPDVAAALEAHPWYGNVRELRNAMQSAVLLSPDGPLRAADLQLASFPVPAATDAAGGAAPGGATPDTSMAASEATVIARALQASAGNLTLAARRLGIAKSKLYAKLRRHGLGRDGHPGVL